MWTSSPRPPGSWPRLCLRATRRTSGKEMRPDAVGQVRVTPRARIRADAEVKWGDLSQVESSCATKCTRRPGGPDSRWRGVCVPRRSEHEGDDNWDGREARSRRRWYPLARSSESTPGTSRSAVPPLEHPQCKGGRMADARGTTPACVTPSAPSGRRAGA